MSADEADAGLEALLGHLKAARGFDFTGYKRPSLERRIRKRMEEVGIADYGDYLEHLELHPDEFALLFDAILINVTEFFRDPAAWQHLTTAVLPALLASKEPDEPTQRATLFSSKGFWLSAQPAP